MSNSRLVYSTESGRICPQCSRPKQQCRCKKRNPAVAPAATGCSDDGVVRIRREVKGRGGKTVTTVHGVPLKETELKRFAKQLKQRCGTGGTVKAGIIVIQGDHREALAREIKAQGFPVKMAGG
jgi:translation initiation factor 1